nr:MAG TPA: hypothetical protein [Microviridae sp.]
MLTTANKLSLVSRIMVRLTWEIVLMFKCKKVKKSVDNCK